VAAVAQARRLALNHEHPERVACLQHQLAPARLLRCRRPGRCMSGVEFAQARKRLFERTAHPAKRGGLFLDDLVLEDIDGRAKITGHRANI